MTDQAATPEQPEQKPGVIERLKQLVTPAPAAPAEKPANSEPAAEKPAEDFARSAQAQVFKRVHIIVNPASGQTGLNLPGLNKVLKDLDIDWEMFVTRRGGEAGERTKQAIAAGVDAVVVYGGDGSVLEVASHLAGSTIPMIIMPGGTANVLSVELGIPSDQTQAALLLGGSPNAVRTLDMATLAGAGENGDLLFFHLGMGIEGTMHEQADRGAKDRDGMMAYVVGALRTLSNPSTAHYHMTLDGQEVEADGINCMVTNFGSVGVPGITLSHAIDVSDGLLDVIVIQDANISTLLSAAANAVASGELAQPLLQWQAREVAIVCDPPQPIVVDGELVKVEKVIAKIVPQAVRVVVPAQTMP
ncbi:MAG: diacylglycerol kinase family protein [Chloroflexota bacterium]